jgi:hypothetical protein
MPTRCAVYARYSSDQQRRNPSATKSGTAGKKPHGTETGSSSTISCIQMKPSAAPASTAVVIYSAWSRPHSRSLARSI